MVTIPSKFFTGFIMEIIGRRWTITALRGRGHFFGEATGRIFSGVLTPFLLEPYTGSTTVFFGTIMVVAVGACVPLLFGKETVGQLELVTEASEEPAY